jgi:hypothetical protein
LLEFEFRHCFSLLCGLCVSLCSLR